MYTVYKTKNLVIKGYGFSWPLHVLLMTTLWSGKQFRVSGRFDTKAQGGYR